MGVGERGGKAGPLAGKVHQNLLSLSPLELPVDWSTGHFLSSPTHTPPKPSQSSSASVGAKWEVLHIPTIPANGGGVRTLAMPLMQFHQTVSSTRNGCIPNCHGWNFPFERLKARTGGRSGRRGRIRMSLLEPVDQKMSPKRPGHIEIRLGEFHICGGRGLRMGTRQKGRGDRSELRTWRTQT